MVYDVVIGMKIHSGGPMWDSLTVLSKASCQSGLHYWSDVWGAMIEALCQTGQHCGLMCEGLHSRNHVREVNIVVWCMRDYSRGTVSERPTLWFDYEGLQSRHCVKEVNIVVWCMRDYSRSTVSERSTLWFEVWGTTVKAPCQRGQHMWFDVWGTTVEALCQRGQHCGLTYDGYNLRQPVRMVYIIVWHMKSRTCIDIWIMKGCSLGMLCHGGLQ